jgi:hypothetical protein
MVHSSHSMVFVILTKAMNFSLNLYLKAYVELKVGGKSIAYLNWMYCYVKHLDHKEPQIIQIDQDVHVCGIFGGSGTPLRSFPSLASF